MPPSPKKPPKWHHPSEVMKLHQLKLKKKALQARINGSASTSTPVNNKANTSKIFDDVLAAKKRKNPSIVTGTSTSDLKRSKQDSAQPSTPILEESADQTLFKLLHPNSHQSSLDSSLLNKTGSPLTSFKDVLNRSAANSSPDVVVVKALGQKHIPVDWSLKKKARLWSKQKFPWNQKLKVSEEASGTTGFVRCLDSSSTNTTNLDTAPNARFHQCCMYWQQPCLPWLSLFPRATGRISDSGPSFAATNPAIKNSLQVAWTDSFRSLFQLIRTKQCPYFYVCSNTFTALFRAAGMSGFGDIHALITPTTRGFRHSLKQEEIEYTMPLKKKRNSDQGYETQDTTLMGDSEEQQNQVLDGNDEEDEDPADEEWLKSMGINAEEIKQLNYTQARVVHKSECSVDNSDQSLVLIEGVEVNALYNFLLNCKSIVSLTGPLAGIPPTLLAPVAFHGATLNSLKVRENKVHVDNETFYSLELLGPILPNTVHNLFGLDLPESNMSATFASLNSTLAFGKVSRDQSRSFKETEQVNVFAKENLRDCGMNPKILERFCDPDKCVTNLECLKYQSDSKTYSWT